MSAKERGWGTEKSVKKRWTSDKNLLLAKYFHKTHYHQATTKQTKINELKIISCYKYEVMRPGKGMVNPTNLKIMFGRLFEEIEFTANSKSSIKVSSYTTAMQ